MSKDKPKDPFAGMNPLQRIVTSVIMKANANRLQDPSGDQFLKVSHKEWLKLREDKEYIPSSKYLNDLLFYTDGSPRATPVRQLVVREMGMYRGKIVYLKDAGPDDYGESHYYVIGYDPKEHKGAPREAPFDPLAPVIPDVKGTPIK